MCILDDLNFKRHVFILWNVNINVFCLILHFKIVQWIWALRTHKLDTYEIIKDTYCIAIAYYCLRLYNILFIITAFWFFDECNNNTIKPVDPSARVNLPEVCLCSYIICTMRRRERRLSAFILAAHCYRSCSSWSAAGKKKVKIYYGGKRVAVSVEFDQCSIEICSFCRSKIIFQKV